MKLRLVSIVLVGFLVIGCGSSGSVYQLPEAQQQGLTYQTYQESTDEAFDAVSQVLENYNSKMLMEDGWEIESSDQEAGTIETGWRETGSSGSVSGGATMGSDSDERYKLNVNITEQGSGSKVSLQLQKQVMMSQWRTFDVTQETAKNHLQPLLNQLDGNLSPQGS